MMTPKMMGAKKLLRRTSFVVVLCYLSVLLLLYIFQRDLLYFPTQTYISPSEAHAPEELKEFQVKTEDGLDLKGWYAVANGWYNPSTSKLITIVFFHGNGDSLQNVFSVAKPYIDAGYGFLLAEYRGYSGLPGEPTETGLYADARAYIKALIAADVKPENIVLFGHSLGTGVATQMASEFPVAGLILLAPYLSIGKIAQHRYPIFPAELLTKDSYENFKKIPGLHMPIFIANGDKDAVVPPEQGRALFALAHEPKKFESFSDRGHNDLFTGAFFDVSLAWLSELTLIKPLPQSRKP